MMRAPPRGSSSGLIHASRVTASRRLSALVWAVVRLMGNIEKSFNDIWGVAAEALLDRVDTLQYVGTNNSARDMDAIRQALGAEQVSYFGFSYGSELGGVWTTLFPTTVRAAVFDGATDPNSDPLRSTLQQGAGFEAALAPLGDRLRLFDDYDKLVSDMSAKVLSGDQVIFMSNGSFGSARQTLTAVLQRTRCG